MTNLMGSQQKLAIDPSHGRKAVNVLTQELTARMRSMSASRPFAFFVVVCALIVGTYYFFIAAPIYVSEASFSVRGRDAPSAASSLLSSLGGGGGGAGGPSSSDVAELQTYIESYGMATKLDQEFHLRAMYSEPRLDFLNRLSANASRDDYLDFYKKMVHVSIDHDTDLIDIRVRSFDPKSAQAIASAVLTISADYLNDLSATVRRDTLRSSEKELQDAEDSVRKARMTMTAYRAKTGTLDPAAAAIATSTGISAMQQEVLELKADMAGALAYTRPHTPEMAETEGKIKGLEAQIAQQQQAIADTKSADSVAERLRTYEGLQVTSDYAERQLVAALSAYDSARTLASERETFVVPAVPPNLPDEPAEPHRLTSFLETMLVLIAVYGIVALAIAGVRDHQGI